MAGVDEARLERTEEGLVARGDGWYVVNLADCRWSRNAKFGQRSNLEGDTRFPELGLGVQVLQPGQPNCHYHRESVQEDFLVLSGECLLLVEEQERPLRAGDFVHCPPGTDHVFVGAGGGPCVLLLVGARRDDVAITYPRSELALRHGAGVEADTDDPRVSYADVPPRETCVSPWPIGA